MTDYSLFSGSTPSLTAAATALVVGCDFEVIQGGLWLKGYQWAVPTGGDTEAGQKFCLYQITGEDAGTIVPGTTVTAGALTAGEYNTILLSSPVLLAPGATPSAGPTYGAAYMACTGQNFENGFPEAKNIFGSGDPDSGGITSGPLFAFSSTGGSLPPGGSGGTWVPQMAYTTDISDPTAGMPTQNDSDANLGIGPIVTTVAPASPTYRMLPNAPVFVVPGAGAQVHAYTLGLPFNLTSPAQVVRGWHYSPSGVTILPTRCGVWNASTMTEVASCSMTSPVWSGAAGSGWVSVTYASPPTLPAGDYVWSTFTSDNTHEWFYAQTEFFTSTAFPDGISPVSWLTYPGPSQYNLGTSWTYPATPNTEYDGIDVELQLAPAPAAPVVVAQGAIGDENRGSPFRKLSLLRF